jgi:hypothetical protein
MAALLALAAPTNQSRLAVLGVTVRAELVAIGRPASEMLTHAITVGAALQEAKQLAGHGHWEDWLGKECGLSWRSARDYLRLYANRDLIETIRQRAADLHELSIRGALRLVRTGTPTRKRKRVPASPLKIADWKAATLTQRTPFVAAIPLTEWLEVIPPAWRAELIDRIDGLRAAQAKPVAMVMRKAA